MFTGLESPVHLLILLVIILLLFGAKRIPDLARSLGRGAREFREGISGAAADKDEVRDHAEAEEKPSVEGAARGEMPRGQEEAEAPRPERKP
jgi:sec-independent protein translocase protein TatA